jgi:hypothetical protein
MKLQFTDRVIPVCHRFSVSYTHICEVRLLGKENESPASDLTFDHQNKHALR